jgi:hypothetical protein
MLSLLIIVNGWNVNILIKNQNIYYKIDNKTIDCLKELLYYVTDNKKTKLNINSSSTYIYIN